MIKHISHALNVVKQKIYERATKRSPEWPKYEHAWLKEQPNCAACGASTEVQVHHVIPFHTNPAKELDMTNYISLCMNVGKDCHLAVGHGGDFKKANPNVRADAAELLAHPERRDEILARAKANRIPNQ